MKRTFVAFAMVACLFVGFASASAAKEVGIHASDVAGGPTVFCKVLKEPDPNLLGGWEGVHHRFKKGETSNDQVQFFLKQVGGQYAIYFYRSKEIGGGRDMRGWRKFTINGNLIESDTGVRFFVENGEVFFSWERGGKQKPTPMTRIPGSESW